MSPLTRRAVAGAVAAIVSLVVSSAPARADEMSQLNEADMTLLLGLRQAAAWEIPAAKAAVEKGSTAKVRQAGQKLADEQAQLDRQTVDVIEKLGATVQAAPTAEQQGALNKLQSAAGSQFDQLFVNSLRDGYGFLYTIVGEVRSSTRITLIRQLADQANVSFLGYMQALESTGLVQNQSLAPAAIPPAQDVSTMGTARANAGLVSPVSPTALWLLVLAAVIVAAITGLRIVRRHGLNADPRLAVRRG
jgi:predicted outer membrane protein